MVFKFRQTPFLYDTPGLLFFKTLLKFFEVCKQSLMQSVSPQHLTLTEQSSWGLNLDCATSTSWSSSIQLFCCRLRFTLLSCCLTELCASSGRRIWVYNHLVYSCVYGWFSDSKVSRPCGWTVATLCFTDKMWNWCYKAETGFQQICVEHYN